MQRRKGRLGEDEARFYFQQLIAGVGHLHGQGMCHRDLKLENTLLDSSRPRRLKVRMGPQGADGGVMLHRRAQPFVSPSSREHMRLTDPCAASRPRPGD